MKYFIMTMLMMMVVGCNIDTSVAPTFEEPVNTHPEQNSTGAGYINVNNNLCSNLYIEYNYTEGYIDIKACSDIMFTHTCGNADIRQLCGL